MRTFTVLLLVGCIAVATLAAPLDKNAHKTNKRETEKTDEHHLESAEDVHKPTKRIVFS
jgi:replication fork clamp-binding protein CrfC